MITHAPADYVCPICVGIEGDESEQTQILQDDIVFRDDKVMVFVASSFIGNNPGHLIVVPIQHYESLYDLPDEIGATIFAAARKYALIMREAYGCEGVTTLQNNEPAGNQHAFHYHLHLFPRYTNDNLHAHMMEKRRATAEERHVFAQKIRNKTKDQS
jgi:histidine triad (HIT) family protein